MQLTPIYYTKHSNVAFITDDEYNRIYVMRHAETPAHHFYRLVQ